MLWTELPWPENNRMSVQEALEIEQPHLMPVPGMFDGYVEIIARVSSTCLVTVKRNRYSVPCRWANRRISVRLYPERLDMYSDDSLIASHARLFDRDHVSYDWQHYIPLLGRKPGALRNGAPFAEMPAPLVALQRELSQRPSGNRLMAEVLAHVPVQGLESVVTAVQGCLTTGYTSIEQIRHMLAHWQERDKSELPEIDTPEALKLNVSPIADTGRYDQLSAMQTPACLTKESEDA
jgi:hypothetical protein